MMNAILMQDSIISDAFFTSSASIPEPQHHNLCSFLTFDLQSVNFVFSAFLRRTNVYLPIPISHRVISNNNGTNNPNTRTMKIWILIPKNVVN